MDDRGSDGQRRWCEDYYWNVTRYTTSGFLRMKLGHALSQRGVAPHIYESAEEAQQHLREIESPPAAG